MRHKHIVWCSGSTVGNKIHLGRLLTPIQWGNRGVLILFSFLISCGCTFMFLHYSLLRKQKRLTAGWILLLCCLNGNSAPHLPTPSHSPPQKMPRYRNTKLWMVLMKSQWSSVIIQFNTHSLTLQWNTKSLYQPLLPPPVPRPPSPPPLIRRSQ